MIALLRGNLASREGDSVVLDVRGVGYLVHLPAGTAEKLPADGEITLHIATLVREDDISLYGFEAPHHREAFELLRTVSGVGSKVALAILGHLGLDALVSALSSGNTAALVSVPGVGKKLAERLCLELKGKIPPHFQVLSAAAPRKAAAEDPLPLALAQLGYRKSEIDAVLASPDVPDLGAAPIEARLKAALNVLRRQS